MSCFLGCARLGRWPSSEDCDLGEGGATSRPSAVGALPHNAYFYRPKKTRGTTSSSTADSNRIRSYKHDVFISFRGPDTRNTFVDHLYDHLIRKGIVTFKDDTQLQKGQSISSQLLQAIKDSRVSIIVFSKDYADSTWCLDEMAAIAQCHTELKQHVFPVFYDVDPSHVRKQGGVYETAFKLHTTRENPKRVDGWKSAMTIFANSVGWDVRNRSELAEIKNIVKEVIKKLGHKFSGLADDLIGVQPRVEELESFLKLSSGEEGIRVLGIWGMSGIGKTTLAKGLYDRISYQFDACCFIETVSKIYKDGGGRNGGDIAVLKEILRQIEYKNIDSYMSSDQICRAVTNRLHNDKLLLVLDDVNQDEQLKKLHIDPKLPHARSRIIITTENEHILKVYGVQNQLMSNINGAHEHQCGKAFKIHEAKLMDNNDAHELLCRKTFVSGDSSNSNTSAELISDHWEKKELLIPQVLEYVQGHPLAITIIGYFLCARNAQEWRATLASWQNNPQKEIMDLLRVSYDEGLGQLEKEIFLHVACFFKGERKDYVMRILDACGLHPQIGIQVIVERSLITIRNQEIHMHGLLQELGKKIVREKHSHKPELWSRLWLYEDFCKAMKTEMKADMEVEAIVLDHTEEHDFDKFNELIRAAKFHKMKHLKLLILYQKKFSGVPVFLSDSLCYFSWNGYPFISFPSRLHLRNLVEFSMPNSSIEQLWTGLQRLPNLKRMDMSNSKNLKMTPRFDSVENLERLDFTGCTNLVEVHPSIGFLKKLQFLSLQNCSSLVSLSFDSGSATLLYSLRVLRLSGCTTLENTPDFTRASYIEYLDMDGCISLSTIHESVGALKKLRFLSLRDCINLVEMPDSFNNMTSLTTLDLCGCSKFKNLPLLPIFDDSSHFLESLVFLDLRFCKISGVPDAIGELRCLERLNLQGNNFSTLPSSIDRLYRLAYLNLSHCHWLKNLPALPAQSDPSDSVGRYFKTTSGSRDHRSGFYALDCPNVPRDNRSSFVFEWLQRFVKEPRHFRCGFDIVVPWGDDSIPQWSNTNHRFKGVFHRGHGWFDSYQYPRGASSSTVRIEDSNMDVDWVGFVFCVAFEVEYGAAISGSPSPIYLSFESEHTEEHFDMPLGLEWGKCDGLTYLWTIYISREHCHFVKTGAQITFKACQGLIMKEWGLRMITKEDTEDLQWTQRTNLPLVKVTYDESMPLQRIRRIVRTHLPFKEFIDTRKESSDSFKHKIQLPYNWFFPDEDEVENDEAKNKETDLFNLGLLTGNPQ